jgi:hypothetical protein
MTTKRVVGLGLVGFVVLALVVACNKPHRPEMVAPTNVSIYNNCTLDTDPVQISVNGQVAWLARDQAYTLLFPNSPFVGIQSNTAFPISQGATGTSGAVTASVMQQCSNNNDPSNPVCRFKYTVTGSGPVACTKDPIVIIMK